MVFRLNILALVVFCCVACIQATDVQVENIPSYWKPDEKASDGQSDEVTRDVVTEVQKLSPRLFVSLEPISYRSQPVAGRNFLVRAIIHKRSGYFEHVHLRIYKPMRGNAELIGYLRKMEPDAPLEFFEKISQKN